MGIPMQEYNGTLALSIVVAVGDMDYMLVMCFLTQAGIAIPNRQDFGWFGAYGLMGGFAGPGLGAYLTDT